MRQHCGTPQWPAKAVQEQKYQRDRQRHMEHRYERHRGALISTLCWRSWREFWASGSMQYRGRRVRQHHLYFLLFVPVIIFPSGYHIDLTAEAVSG
jgi:hypothetical protein